MRREYRIVWMCQRRRQETRGPLSMLCAWLVDVFGGDAHVRRDGRSYEVIDEAGSVVARLCVDVYSSARAELRRLLAGGAV